ncbi:MAG TPA: class I SAM-dependent methyltransferase [Gemmatimonadales bacterium]|nr:class I SAM-dependent methyltransferase [Gemmatimonadales bacterium]
MAQPLTVVEAEREPRRDLDLFVLDRVTIQAWDRLLFVGCGDGWIVEEAWRRALRAYACGIETSALLVAQAAELRGVPGKLEFKTWDGQHAPCEDGAFRRVIATLALHAPRGPAGILAELHRVLEPRGHLYVFDIDRRTDDEGATPPAFGAALHRAGFRDIRELARRDIPLAPDAVATGAIVHARA